MKMEYIQVIQYYLQDYNTKLMLSFVMVVITGISDFVLGVVMASVKEEVKFRTKVLKKGFATKVGIWLLCLLIIPLFMMLNELNIDFIHDNNVGLGVIYIIHIVFIFSELKSFMGHLTGGDGKEHGGISFVVKVFSYIEKKIKEMFGDIDG